MGSLVPGVPEGPALGAGVLPCRRAGPRAWQASGGRRGFSSGAAASEPRAPGGAAAPRHHGPGARGTGSTVSRLRKPGTRSSGAGREGRPQALLLACGWRVGGVWAARGRRVGGRLPRVSLRRLPSVSAALASPSYGDTSRWPEAHRRASCLDGL